MIIFEGWAKEVQVVKHLVEEMLMFRKKKSKTQVIASIITVISTDICVAMYYYISLSVTRITLHNL